MAKFHLMHCIPKPNMHGLNGYKEVIESVAWKWLDLKLPGGLIFCDARLVPAHQRQFQFVRRNTPHSS